MFLQKRSENDTRTLKLCKIRKKGVQLQRIILFFPLFSPKRSLNGIRKTEKPKPAKQNVM